MACKHTRKLLKPALLVWCLCLAPHIYGQKEAQFSQFSLNQLFFNPAAAGAEGLARFNVIHRSQYAGYQPTALDREGAPSTQLFSASVPVRNLGIGFYAMNDRLGALSQQDIQLSVSYKIPFAGGNLAVGGRAGLYRQALDYDQLRPEDPDDPLILSGTVSEIHPDVALGIRYENNRFYAGFSAAHLLKPEYRFDASEGSNPLTTTYYFNAGMFISVGYLVEVQPMVLIKTDGALAAEGGALVTYDRRFFGGVTYRPQDAFAIVHAGASLLNDQSLRISGAYDFVMGGNNIKSPSSYEIMLSYAFAAKKAGKKTIIRTPRFRF